MALVRRRLWLDSARIVHTLPPAGGKLLVLALPEGLPVEGRLLAELLEHCRLSSLLACVDYLLQDYLPHYQRKLLNDLTVGLAEGKCVHVWDKDAVILIGYPHIGETAWTDTEQWYKSAADALTGVHPITME
jgi:hypothetical protein